MALLPFGLGGTRYGVRIGSMASADQPTTFYGVGNNANWGQGPTPFYDATGGLLSTGGSNPAYAATGQWSAMPYLRPSNPVLFDIGAGGSAPYSYNQKMVNPQDILIPQATAVDTSMAVQQSAFYGLGSFGATGVTMSAPSFGVNITTMMIDVSVECMLAGIDINQYKTTLNQNGANTSTIISAGSPSQTTAYFPMTPGCWITAAEMFSNPAIYAYIGVRDDSNYVLGVVPYVNCSLAKLTYSFASGSGITRSLSLVSPWSVEFTRAAIEAWYAKSPRYRLTTPGIQVGNTAFASVYTNDYDYATVNSLPAIYGGEFMSPYSSGANYSTSPSGAGSSTPDVGGMFYVAPLVGTPGSWGFIAPPAWLLMGTPTGNALQYVYMPSMGVGRDCFLDFSFFNGYTGNWEWASYYVNSNKMHFDSTSTANTLGPSMQAVSPTAAWPGGVVRLQGFTIDASSRASLVEEMGNRAMVGSVSQPPTVRGSFSVLETDVGLWTQIFQLQVKPYIDYAAPSVAAGPPKVATIGSPVATAVSSTAFMSDPGTPMRLNAVMTVATPGPMRLAMLRFVVPNIRVANAGRRVVVNGVASRQYSFTSEDGGVASASALGGGSPATYYAAQGNLALNTTATPDTYGIRLGNFGGNTGSMCVQSFFCVGL